MSTMWRRLRAPLAALTTVGLVALGPGAASAEEGSLGDLLVTVTEPLAPTSQETSTGGTSGEETALKGELDGATQEEAPTSTTLVAPSAPLPSPSSDDDSTGHETEDPARPDHGRATLVDAVIGDQELVTVGENDATVKDDDSTTADSTLLAIGGEEVLGTHADSEGTEESHFGDPLAPLCEGSEGQVCLRVLYADAWTSDDGETSSSRSQSGVADVCVGGDDADPQAECSGPVAASAAASEAQVERDQESGRTTASSESDAADVCLERDATGMCAVGASALHSEGESDSGGAQASARRGSYLAALELGNEEQGRIGDPQAIAIPPDCPEGESLLCLFLNQGETYVGDGIAGHAQEALHVDALPGNLDLVVEVGRTETLVHNDGGEVAGEETDDDGDGPDGNGPGGDGPDDGDVAGVSDERDPGSGDEVAGVEGVLPNAGGVWSGLIALGLLGMGAGALLMAYSRRRMGAAV